MRRLLARRDARLYLGGQALSLFGDTAMWLALGIWAKQLTGSSGAAGLVIFAIALPQLAAPAAGMLVDRVNRRRLLIVTNLVTAAAVLPLLAVHDRGDLWLIYGVALAYGASYSILGAGQTALLGTMLPEDLLAEANGALQTLREAQRLVAPLAGAGLFSVLGGASVALIDAATFLAAAAALILMRVDEPPPAPRDAHPLAEALAGARHLRATVPLRQMVLASAVCLVGLGLSETLVYAIADAGLHRSPSFVGVLMATQGVGAIVGAINAARFVRRSSEGILAGVGMAAVAAGALLMTSGALVVVLVGKVLFGLGAAWIIVGAITLLQRLTPGPLQGRAYSAAELLLGAPQTLSIAAGAALVTVVDYRWLLLTEAAVLAACATYLLTRREQRPSRRHTIAPRAIAQATFSVGRSVRSACASATCRNALPAGVWRRSARQIRAIGQVRRSGPIGRSSIGGPASSAIVRGMTAMPRPLLASVRTAAISVQMKALRGCRPRPAIVRSRRLRSAELSR
jgi:MFS family permease